MRTVYIFDSLKQTLTHTHTYKVEHQKRIAAKAKRWRRIDENKLIYFARLQYNFTVLVVLV